MDFHQDHHLLHPRRLTTNWIYLLLGVILITSYIWQEYDNGVAGKWHIFYDVEYSLYWYIALMSWSLRPLLYIIVAILSEIRHRKLLITFMLYESVLFLDFVLVYSQSNVRRPIAIIMAIYMVWYHYKYEPHR